LPVNVGFPLPTRISADAVERGFDVRKYLNFVWRHWMLIGAFAVLALVLALIYLARATPLYTASAQVLLELQRERIPGDTNSDAGRGDDVAVIENQLAILRSDSLLKRVVVRERLGLPPPSNEQKGASQDDQEAKEKTEAQLIQNGINRVRGALVVKRSGLSYALDISITWDDPFKAGQLANAVADAFVTDQLDARLDAAKRASGWLSDRLVELRQQLRSSEDAVADFRAAHGLTRTGLNVALNEQQLSDLNGKLLAARTDAAEKKTRVDFLADVAIGKKSLDSLPASFQSAVQSGVMGTLRQKLADASQREADLLARYSSRHPAVVNVEAEKQDIQRNIAAETQRMVEAVRNEYALAKAREQATEQAMREATGQGGLDSADAVRLRELERTAAVNKSLFEDFLQKAKLSEEQSTFRARDVRVIAPAASGGQSFPNSRRVLMMALLVGIGLGVGGALAIEMMNTGFTTAREVEQLLEIPVLASVDKIDKGKLKKDGANIPAPFYQLHFPLSAFSESIRTLRSGILMSDVDRPPKIIHVTSSCPGEGKSTIAVSLAISAATAGQKVAILDADLRHPSTSKFFNLDQNKGLVDLLTGAASIGETMVRKDSFVIIPAGAKSLNPPDVLGSERMKTLIGQLRDNFDYVVIDSPPVGPVVDSVILAGLADKTIFVIQWASTARDLIQTCIQKVSVQKRLGGIVMNLVILGRAKKYGPEIHYGRREYAKYYSES
jgi:capsular exopolysaccharide synthesis family protein